MIERHPLGPGYKAASLFLFAVVVFVTGCKHSGSSGTYSISVAPTELSIAVNGTQQFSATAVDSSGNAISDLTFTWASSAPSVMSINSSTGLATAVALGTAQITAAASGVTSPPGAVTVTSITTIAVAPSPAFMAVNNTLQFSATATGSGVTLPGTSFTWASSAPSVVSIGSTTGLATAVATGTAQITATANGVTSASATATVTAISTITVAPSPAVVMVGSTEQFVATATDSNNDVIAGTTFNWVSSASNVATIGSNTGLASGISLGTTQITASANGVTSAPATLAVTNPQGELNGAYAFLLQGFDDVTSDQFAIVGSFSADGNGNITNGVEDINGPGGYQSTSFQGTYALGFDGRGKATISNSLGASNTFALAVGSLNGNVASAARIIEFDDTTGNTGKRGTGAIYLQTPSTFGLSSIQGPYALQFFGQHATTGSWYVNTGAFIADGNGNLSNGELDTNSGTTPVQNASFTATLATTSSTSANGRLAFGFASGAQANGVIYIVSQSQMLFMETDAESSNGIEAGQILAQASNSFSNASLNGVTVEYEEGLGSTANRGAAGIGLMSFNSAGAATLNRDYDDSGTTTTQTASLSYSVSANGRTILEANSSPVAILYLVDQNKGFIMSLGASATRGFFEGQSAGPFSNASISGSYFLGSIPPAVANPNVVSGMLSSDGSGSVTVTQEVSSGNGLFTGETGLLEVAVGATGRTTDNLGVNNVYYIVSPTKFLLLISNGPSAPEVDIIQH